jgi:peptidoglycan L-alanyl-D-glutamate endopeptidase CwlK
MMSPRDIERLQGCHPTLVEKLTLIYDEMDKLGYPLFVVEGFRTDSRQAYLYGLGRTQPGQIVTYKDGVNHRSNHQPHSDGFGYAVDSAFVPNSQRKDPFSRAWPWETFGVKCEAHGLIWGGRWKMVDLPHVELPVSSPLPLSV